MSWHYSRALVLAYSERGCLDGIPSALLNSTSTQGACWSPDKTMDVWNPSRFGMTFAPLTGVTGAGLLTLFRVASLAKTLPVADLEPESRESNQGYGKKWPASLAKYDPVTLSLKTHQHLLFGEGLESLQTLPPWGVMRNGELYRQRALVRPTKGPGCGLWPTPSGTSNHGSNHVSGVLQEWGGSSNPFRGTELQNVRCASFEEWMMGAPTGWTDLTASVTHRFRQWLSSHGRC
jgi:hypothetical protein